MNDAPISKDDVSIQLLEVGGEPLHAYIDHAGDLCMESMVLDDRLYFNQEQATALRDWLNKVLP